MHGRSRLQLPGRHGPGLVRRLIVFTRYPQAGQVKTRLIPALGAEGAADLQRAMTRHTLTWARRAAADPGVSLEVRYTGGDSFRMRATFGDDLTCRPQAEGDLGERMERALAVAFAEGTEAAVLVGCDCPGLDAGLARRAFVLLEACDLVVGPALDGGYYLLGLSRPAPTLFRGIPWGTGRVLGATRHAARRLGLSCRDLPALGDVDCPADLDLWRTMADADATSKSSLP